MPFIVIRLIFFGLVVAAIYILWLNYQSQTDSLEEEDPLEKMDLAIANLMTKIKVIEQKIPTVAACRETTLANIDVQQRYHQDWMTKAEEAIATQDDEWGKECLKRALMARRQLENLQQELEIFDQKLRQLEHGLNDHQYKLDTIRGKYQSIQGRMELAQTEQEMNEVLAEVQNGQIFSLIDDIESRVAEDEHKLEAMNGLYRSNELSFDEIDELTVQTELKRLKQHAG